MRVHQGETMYCEICKIDTGSFCIQCGRDLLPSGQDINPPQEQPWLWNPDVAALLSMLVFTGLFGSLIHAANWKRMGRVEHMWRSIGWGIGLIVVWMGVLLYGHFNLDIEFTFKWLMAVNFIHVAMWYFASGRVQSKVLAYEMNNQYRHESWIIPAVLAVMLVALLRMSANILKIY